MFRTLFISVAAILLFANSSEATTLYISLGTTASPIASSSYDTSDTRVLNPSILVSDVNDYGSVVGTVGVASDSFASGLVTAIRPDGDLYGGQYLYVGEGSSVSYTLTSSTNMFGLTWGTVDSDDGRIVRNTLTLFDDSGASYKITGNDIWNLTLSGQVDVVINSALVKIKTFMFGAGEDAFEVANLSVSTVPLPASLLLFGSGLASLASLGARKKAHK